jgi:hypothetical protein
MPTPSERPKTLVRALAATDERRLRMSKDLVRIKFRNFPQAHLGRRLLLAGTK